MITPSLRGRFLWHELLTTDTAAALRFYTDLVGWKSEAWEQIPNYTLLFGSRGPVAGVMNLPEQARAMGAPPSWLSYVGTPDVDATVEQALGLGGRVLTTPTNIPVGRFAILADPQGAVFGIYTPNLLSESDTQSLQGEFSWHELVTSDPAAAFSFYQQLFGWEKTTAMDMGELGTYQLYGLPGLEMGGIYKLPPGYPAPPNWLPYVVVANCHEAASFTTSNGGQIMNGPMEVPGGDMIAMGMDPQGAAFAVHSKKAEAPPAEAKPAARKPAAKKPAKKAAPKKKAAARKKTVAKKKTVARKKAAPKKKAAARKPAKKKAPAKKKSARKSARRGGRHK